MRVVLVGTPHERQRLRTALTRVSWQIVGEFDSLPEARRLAPAHDAFLLGETSPVITRDDHEPLTPRESDVLVLMAEGLPNKAIASRLGISDQTVKFHVASVCAKLGARNRTSAVRVALAKGLITV